MSKFEKLYKELKNGKTLLGVGAVSWNCIDAAIELANEYKIPILLIASRRQVEWDYFGGGYVTDTKTFSNYIKNKDDANFVFVCRDHSGPWQGSYEDNLFHDEAMMRAFSSCYVDIESGFDILHLDPSLKKRPLTEIIDDVKSLYHVCEGALKSGQQIIYEAGTEEHSGQIRDPESFEFFVKQIKKDCPKIKFVVGNMGFYVKELTNIGQFSEQQAKKLITICNDNDLYLKGHNTDYISNYEISYQKHIGVHSINVAPEFGVAETKELIMQLENNGMKAEANKFIEIAVASKKWEKWMIDVQNTKNDLYKAKICGHYVYNHPEVLLIKERAQKQFDLQSALKKACKDSILRYLKNLGWV